ncbi:MAG: putative beta-lysine N-acetyltransferase [Methanoculleus sp.]|jgi:putative beta-lysine N-acetyltransferase
MFSSLHDQKDHISRTGADAASRRHAAKKTYPPPGRLPGQRSHRPRRGAHADTITKLGRSLIHHGPYNDRIFLYHLDLADLPGITDRLLALAKDRGYPRIFARIPAPAHDHFVACGYTPGARLPGLFRGKVDGYYMARYIDAPEGDAARTDDVLAVALEKARKSAPGSATLEPGFAATSIAPGDAPALASIYRDIFETYPVPIHDPAYLAGEMQGSLRCFCILDPGGRIASVAAAEVDVRARFAEMTGFATLPDYRGRGFAGYLLQRMEEDMRSFGVQTTFAVARARSYPANITFARAGYAYAGTLADCTNICGSLEDMNIWCRSLTPLQG